VVVKNNNMGLIKLKCIVDIYSKPDIKTGIQKLIKRDVTYYKLFETAGLLVEQYINPKGIPSKMYSTIKQGEEYFKVKHKFEEIEKLISPYTFNGFKLK
jgi:hypothetical protein